jgi:hypothetical protein
MTDQHEPKHSSVIKESKVPTLRDGLGNPFGFSADHWSIVALGLNVWIVTFVWPISLSTDSSLWERLLLPLPPALLLLGIYWTRSRKVLAPRLLLAAFPISTLAPIALRFEERNQLDYTPVVLLFASISLAAYIAFTASASSRAGHVRECEYKPLPLFASTTDKPSRSRLRQAIVTLTIIGAFCIAVIGPSAGGLKGLKRDWGRTAMQGGLFTAVVALSLATAVVVLFLGPVLRAGEDRQPTKAKWRRKLVSALILSLIGYLTYYLTQMR